MRFTFPHEVLDGLWFVGKHYFAATTSSVFEQEMKYNFYALFDCVALHDLTSTFSNYYSSLAANKMTTNVKC